MAYLLAYQKLHQDDARQQKKLVSLLESLNQNLLQSDTSDQVEEKLVSLGGSFIVMMGISTVMGLFGIATGGLGWVVLFLMGFVVSKSLGRYWFGKPREKASLTPVEHQLLHQSDQLLKTCKQRLMRTKVKKEPFACSYYPNRMEELEAFGRELQGFSANHLAYKYRFRQNSLKKDWLVACQQLKKILAQDPV
ncbi:MAG: hypothetical protein IBX50_16010 [Marinospirillum sp.]|uniref:hypothetical protein n=1 Tax=Marinospirillum sp. TaxID=2183934 RepID=UPI001A093269|nr:hypothetical protein [Marinospirillum sp.]MBE0508195.1 hypothetical protein [Marinospirillum sp.]